MASKLTLGLLRYPNAGCLRRGVAGIRKADGMERDSLVYLAATGGYGSVFELTEDGACEVGLIDPLADDYSICVPATQLVEVPTAAPQEIPSLLDGLALFHLRIRRGLDVSRAFELYLGRNEDGILELWFSGGVARASLVRPLEAGAQAVLAAPLFEMNLPAWRAGGPAAEGVPSLDRWSWSLELVGGERGVAAFGRGAAFPQGLPALCERLAGLGAPIRWGQDGPAFVGSCVE